MEFLHSERHPLQKLLEEGYEDIYIEEYETEYGQVEIQVWAGRFVEGSEGRHLEKKVLYDWTLCYCDD